MGLIIESSETELRVRELAELTGESAADAVDRAVRERLARIRLHRAGVPGPARPPEGRRLEALREIVRAFQGLPARRARFGAMLDEVRAEAARQGTHAAEEVAAEMDEVIERARG